MTATGAAGFNRWFDKTFSLIFTAQGAAGINFEHSWGDGFPVGYLLTTVRLGGGMLEPSAWSYAWWSAGPSRFAALERQPGGGPRHAVPDTAGKGGRAGAAHRSCRAALRHGQRVDVVQAGN